jgi:hypothetical protein
MRLAKPIETYLGYSSIGNTYPCASHHSHTKYTFVLSASQFAVTLPSIIP